MKTLHLAIFFLILILSSITFPIVQNASAHGVCTGLQPRFGRLDDTTLSKQFVQTGDSITITGNITSMVQENFTGWFTIHSIPGPNGRWELSHESARDINIPGESHTPYSITTRALQPGVYQISPLLHLVGLDGGFSIFNGCNTEPTVTITGQPICMRGLVAVSKAEDGTIFCVKSGDAQNLVHRGWAKEIIPSMSIAEITQTKNQTSSDALELLLSTNSTSIKPNQTLGIDITLNNTSSNVLVKDSSDNWSMKGLMGPCELDPVGIDVYSGNYFLENVTGARPLQMYQNGTYNCPALTEVDKYIFEPSSDKDISETPNGNFTGEARYHVSFDGFYTLDGFQVPPVGAYTIVASDEWGHVTIQHFTVVNKTQNVINTAIMKDQNSASGFRIYSGGSSISLSPT